jgi:hypothetical protein
MKPTAMRSRMSCHSQHRDGVIWDAVAEYVIDCGFLVNSNEQKQTIFSALFPYHTSLKYK